MQHDKIIIAGASVVSTVAGSLAGWFYAKKKLASYYEELSAQEIADAKEFYSVLNKKDDFDTPEKAAKKLGVETEPSTIVKEAAEALVNYQGQKVSPVKPEEGLMEVAEETREAIHEENDPEPTTNNIFVNGQVFDPDQWDIEAERENRDQGKPYVVTDGEYEENLNHHEQQVLTWFESDQVLVDENETVIDDVEGTVGRANMNRFGHGSGDPQTVFIRNDSREIDFEVLRDNSSYSETVLGLTPDVHLEHSAMPKRRNRVFDE